MGAVRLHREEGSSLHGDLRYAELEEGHKIRFDGTRIWLNTFGGVRSTQRYCYVHARCLTGLIWAVRSNKTE
jgi:hypothetical protein